MQMRMFVQTIVLFGAFTVVHNQQQGTPCSFETIDEFKSPCMKSFVCALKMNDTCSNDKVIDCMDLKLKNCTGHDKETLKKLVSNDIICKFGGVQIRSFVTGTGCSQNASYCTSGFHQMWQNDMFDRRLGSKFDEMKICLKKLFGSEECINNVTITNLEDKLDNPFKDCRGSGSTSESPHTPHGGSMATRSYGMLSAFIVMVTFIISQ